MKLKGVRCFEVDCLLWTLVIKRVFGLEPEPCCAGQAADPHQVSRIGHLSKLLGPGCGGQIYWIADMVQKLLILKWTIVVDDIKHTSKDDKVDLPHPLVPHKSIVTDSFLSLILIRTVGKEKKGNVTKKGNIINYFQVALEWL